MEKLQLELVSVLFRSLESEKCPDEVKRAIHETLVFMRDEVRFKRENNLELLQRLGKKLNKSQEMLNEKLEEIIKNHKDKFLISKSLKDKFYLLGNFCILNYYPYSNELSEYVAYIKNNHSLQEKSIKDSFDILFNEYSIIQEIYDKNGIDGIARLIALNNKIYKKNASSIVTLVYNNIIDKFLILNVTSTESVLSQYKSSVQAQKILSRQIKLDEN